jgi:hypothetical protein
MTLSEKPASFWYGDVRTGVVTSAPCRSGPRYRERTMIVVLDTNALRGDVYAEKQWAETLFGAAAERDDLEVWVPSVVVEELVRQFPERLRELEGAGKKLRNDAFALGWNLPALPETDNRIAEYRDRLEDRLRSPGVRIAPPPSRAGLIAEWVAQRRRPIPGDGTGAVDAQIWLTTAEAAATPEQVVLITNNHTDFCDPDDHSRLHEVLRGDLDTWGVNDARVKVFPRILDFNQQHVVPSLEATEEAERLLADTETHSKLVSEIEAAVSWFPLDAEDWPLGADIDEATLEAFDVGTVRLVRADPGPRGLSMTIEVYGTATLDLAMVKAEAYGLPDESPIVITNWDWNEWNVSAQAEVEGAMLVEVLYADESSSVSIDALEPLDNEQVLAFLERWAEADGEAACEVVAETFDVGGQQEARAATPNAVRKFYFKEGALYVRAEFTVDYANPVDDEDMYMSAENVVDHLTDLRVEAPDLENIGYGDVASVEHAFAD